MKVCRCVSPFHICFCSSCFRFYPVDFLHTVGYLRDGGSLPIIIILAFCCTLGCIWRVSQTPLTSGVHDNGRPRRVPLEDVMKILKPSASSIDGRPGRLPKAYWQVAKGVLAFPANCAICITNDGLISFFSRSCYCCRRHCYCWLCPLPVGLPKTEPPSYSPLPLTLPPYAPVPFLRTFVGRCGGGVRSFVCQEAPPGGRSTLYNKRR